MNDCANDGLVIQWTYLSLFLILQLDMEHSFASLIFVLENVVRHFINLTAFYIALKRCALIYCVKVDNQIEAAQPNWTQQPGA